MRVTIAGGGIAGMATAAAFGQRGADVAVLEQAPAIAEIGAGLQISPNGAAVLAALGLGPEADRRAIRARAVQPMDGISGRTIGSFDLAALPGHPYRFFHRADLLDMLAGAATRAGARIVTGERVTTISPEGQITTAAGTLTDHHPNLSGRALTVGADGLHSVLRPRLNPANGSAPQAGQGAPDAPFFTGQTAWRALVTGDHPPVARIWMLPGRHVVTYPLPGGRINIVAVRETRVWAADGWHHADDPAHLNAAFADAAPELRAMLARVDDLRLWGLFRHPVAANWHGTAAVLVGDAAHPTLPFLGQGANLALEDAFLVARIATGSPDLAAALADFQAIRRPRVIRAITAANANAVNYHLGGFRRRAAHLALRGIATLAPRAFLARLSWLYDHDVTRDPPHSSSPNIPG